jgi:hypothetical protein
VWLELESRGGGWIRLETLEWEMGWTLASWAFLSKLAFLSIKAHYLVIFSFRI